MSDISRTITRRAALAGLATAMSGLFRQAGAQAPEALPADSAPTFTARPTPLRLQPGRPAADLWTFNGALSPVLRLKQGEELWLSLENRTPQPLSLHFHGVRGPNAMDGVGGLTQSPVPGGQTYEYRFTPPDSGTFLIRPCVPGNSAEPLERGLSGLLIVEEPDPPQADRDVALIVDDWLLNDDGSLAPFGKERLPAPAGRLGNWLSLNGQPAPHRIEAPPGGRVRLRLANACNARAMRLRVDNLKAQVIAVDGQPSASFEPLGGALPFVPGNRYDLLLDLPSEVGAIGGVTALLGDGVSLVEIVTAGERRSPLPPMAALPPNPRLPQTIALQNAVRKDAVLAGDQSLPDAPWTINGAAGDPSGAPLLSVKRGKPVVLALTNRTPLMQPLHLHGHSFRLLHALDDGWEPYFLDTVQVPGNRTVRIAFIADNPGRWLLASTVMERFDAGLWTFIEVT